ncbi:hypothetical protein [Halorussus halobius]|uniref:hypothetical protein n=1 Tax=Halorussus halobius TaxID=1710537 RepID=UPI001091B821|nr:hypothetical protein [Halorussus halobius]
MLGPGLPVRLVRAAGRLRGLVADRLLAAPAVVRGVIRLPIRRCPNCGYVGPTRRFATDGRASYRCPRCGHAVESEDPRLL